jgi:serine protease Do
VFSMNRKQGIFLLGSITGAVFMFLILFMGSVFTFGKQNSVDVFEAIDYTIQTATPNVVGVVNVKATEDTGTGSGVIYKLTEEEAYIVTNYHVVKDADEIEVAFQDEKRVKASLVGEDMLTDLAVIKIEKGDINHYMAFADSDQTKVGDFVIAIGNPLGLDLYGSATLGIVSSKLRLIPVDVDKNGEDDYITSVIQTDAAINPGNSGGALVNIEGKLLGINSMKIAGTQIEGIGFSIPTNIVKDIIYDLENYQMVIRPYIGIHVRSVENISDSDKEKWNLKDVEEGVYVNDVTKNSASDLAGIKVNDVITKVNGEAIKDVTELRYKLYGYGVGDVVKLTIFRNQETLELEVTLQQRSNVNVEDDQS